VGESDAAVVLQAAGKLLRCPVFSFSYIFLATKRVISIRSFNGFLFTLLLIYDDIC
jgi:hypothetical protein